MAFIDEAIKEGVFPCFSACLCSCSCVISDSKGSPPDEAFWKGAEVRRAWQKTKMLLEGLEQEKRDHEAQRTAGSLPVVRINGKPGSVKHTISKKWIEFTTKATAGVPEAMATSGVLYYEITLIKLPGWSEPRFGFSREDDISAEENLVDTSIGNDDKSYAVGGKQIYVNYDGKKLSWPSCSWKKGDVVGLACNIDRGQFAISINGEWSGEGSGLAFEDEGLKSGVYPCFTADDCTIKCALSDFNGSPPEAEFWAEAKVREPWRKYEVSNEVREATTTFASVNIRGSIL